MDALKLFQTLAGGCRKETEWKLKGMGSWRLRTATGGHEAESKGYFPFSLHMNRTGGCLMEGTGLTKLEKRDFKQYWEKNSGK